MGRAGRSGSDSAPGSLANDGFEWFPRTGGHRYFLEQTFNRPGPTERPLVVIALNPAANTLEGYRRSDTFRKAKIWASTRQFDGVIYLNLFTIIEGLSSVLHRADLAVADEADQWFITSANRSPSPVVAAWGNRPPNVPRELYAMRVGQVLRLLAPRPIVCLGLTATGNPRHPRVWKRSVEPQAFTPDPESGRMAPSARTQDRLLVRFEVEGRPATFATAYEAAWKALVRQAVADASVGPWPDQRFAVRLEFRTPAPMRSSEVWDLDNLIKPTLDAMEGVFGLRQWRGAAQPADDRVDRIEASKRTVRPGEGPGVSVEVRAVAVIND